MAIPNHILFGYLMAKGILLNERLSIRPNGSILIDNIQEFDAGQYTCLAENINGKINATADLEVLGTSFL